MPGGNGGNAPKSKPRAVLNGSYISVVCAGQAIRNMTMKQAAQVYLVLQSHLLEYYGSLDFDHEGMDL